MNSKPLDTAMADFTTEEIEAMDEAELFARAAHSRGNLQSTLEAFSVDIADEVLQVFQYAVLLMATAPPEIENPTQIIAPILGQRLYLIALANIEVGRQIERFVAEYPDFPEEAPVEVGASDNGAAADESASESV